MLNNMATQSGLQLSNTLNSKIQQKVSVLRGQGPFGYTGLSVKAQTRHVAAILNHWNNLKSTRLSRTFWIFFGLNLVMIEEDEFSDVTRVHALKTWFMARTSVCLPPVEIKPVDKNSVYPSHTDGKLEYFKGLS